VGRQRAHQKPAPLRTHTPARAAGAPAVSAFGDSVLLDAGPTLDSLDHSVAVDAVVGRQAYDTLNDVVSALQDKQIDAFVTDTPTAQYMASAQIPHSVLIGQFPSNDEYYGLLFAKGNPLVSCVNQAITKITDNGTLNALQTKYLQIYTSVPTIQP